MSSEVEADAADSEVRRRSATGSFDASAALPPVTSAPVLTGASEKRPPYLLRAVALVAVLLLGLIGYEAFTAPKDDGGAWAPPEGLTAEDTPPWLQTLCGKRTRELCAVANRARNPSDCADLRATLHQLEGLERTLTASGALSSRQRWVLVELYGQGHQLCQFVHGGASGKPK